MVPVSQLALYTFNNNMFAPGSWCDQWEDNLEYDKNSSFKLQWIDNKRKKSFSTYEASFGYTEIGSGTDFFLNSPNQGNFNKRKPGIFNNFNIRKQDIIAYDRIQHVEEELTDYVLMSEEGEEYEYDYE